MYGFQYNEVNNTSAQQNEIGQSTTFASLTYIIISLISSIKLSTYLFTRKKIPMIATILLALNIIITIYIFCTLSFGHNRFDIPKRYLFSGFWNTTFLSFISFIALIIILTILMLMLNVDQKTLEILLLMFLLLFQIWNINYNTSLDDYIMVYNQNTGKWIISQTLINKIIDKNKTYTFSGLDDAKITYADGKLTIDKSDSQVNKSDSQVNKLYPNTIDSNNIIFV